MEDYLKQALEIVKAQASVRTMTEEEISSMVFKLATAIRHIGVADEVAEQPEAEITAVDSSKALKEKSITCLECGKSFKIITRRHLAMHDMSPEEYRDKYGYKKDMPLVCKSLQRERRKKMKDMKLWEKRRKNPLITA